MKWRSIPIAWRVAALLGVAAAAAALTLSRPSVRDEVPRSPGSASGAPSPAAPLPDWCAPGFDAIPGGCLAAPADPGPRPLIVYLHGRYARDAASDEIDRQRRLAARAKARGFAVVALRGQLGACTGQGLSTWFCWPNGQPDEVIAAFLRSWNQTLDLARARARSPALYLLGFSNGGYFVGLVATRGLLDASAFVIAHGGPVEPLRAIGNKRPMLLLSADDDVAQDDMIRFDEELAHEGWDHESYARFGGHGLTDEDIDSAIAFFASAGARSRFSPPSSLHRPVRHARDAGDPFAPPPPAGASSSDAVEAGVSPAPSTDESESDE